MLQKEIFIKCIHDEFFNSGIIYVKILKYLDFSKYNYINNLIWQFSLEAVSPLKYSWHSSAHINSKGVMTVLLLKTKDMNIYIFIL